MFPSSTVDWEPSIVLSKEILVSANIKEKRPVFMMDIVREASEVSLPLNDLENIPFKPAAPLNPKGLKSVQDDPICL